MTKLEQEMLDVLENVLQEFEDRYDGAPDAKMQWMGELMHQIKTVMAKAGRTA